MQNRIFSIITPVCHMILKIIQWTAFIWNQIFWNFINAFVVTLDQLNAKNHITDLKLLNGSANQEESYNRQ